MERQMNNFMKAIETLSNWIGVNERRTLSDRRVKVSKRKTNKRKYNRRTK